MEICLATVTPLCEHQNKLQGGVMAIPFRIRAQSAAKPILLPNVDRKVKRDFRLWLGIGLLLMSILTISHLIAAAGARTQTVVLAHDVAAGKQLTIDDLEVVRVALPSAHNYVSAIDLALGMSTTRNMTAGELIPASLGATGFSKDLRSVSLPIKAGHLPALQSGDLVDIWSTPSSEGLQIPGPPSLISSAASVADVPTEVDPNSDTAVTVLLAKNEVGKIIAALRDGQIDVVVLAHGGGEKQ